MHPIFETGKNFAVAAGLWFLLSVLVCYFLQSQVADFLSIEQAITVLLPWLFIFFFFCLSNYYICLAFPIIKMTFTQVMTIQVSATVSTVILWYFLGYVWVAFLIKAGQPDWTLLLDKQKMTIATIAAILYCFWVLAHYVYLMALQQETLEREVLQKKLFLSQIELQTVKATTHPHFLYNALNTVANLSLVKPEKVYNLCIQMSDFLRYSVNYSKNTQVTIHQEIEHIQNYLGIERERFGDRLKTLFDVDEEQRNKRAIPLLLFPLVENAIKHGIDSLLEGGCINIQIKNQSRGSLISVSNPYDPLGVKASSTQLGLAALKKRLLVSYGVEAYLKVHRQNCQFVVTLFLPENING